MKICAIVGARPQFIKAAVVLRALMAEGHQPFLLHTGQHYDDTLSGVFFRQLDLPEPDIHLGVGSGPNGWQTGRMLMGIEQALMDKPPDAVMVFGDTNSTAAGALAAAKAGFPLAHVEAGLRSFVKHMPEEQNRIIADHLADLRFCPTPTAVRNLEKEGITQNVHLVGDVMAESLKHYIEIAETSATVLSDQGLAPGGYALATAHRAENTKDRQRLTGIFQALLAIAQGGLPVAIPLHPGTRRRLKEIALSLEGLIVLPPLPYLDMLMLIRHARLVLTDSGGVLKEAFWLKTPCVVLREETEWVEMAKTGAVRLAGSRPEAILSACREVTAARSREETSLPADGEQGPGERIARIMSLWDRG